MTSETNVAYRNVAYRCVAAPADRSNQMAAIGEIVPGKVTKLVPFGAFVHIEEGIQSLVHISELAERHLAGVSGLRS